MGKLFCTFTGLGLLPLWPIWEDVVRTMPSAFKEIYPDTFAIIELRCKVPLLLCLQSQHYSAYKSHTAMESLVGTAPNGSFIFVSELYTGSISDRQLLLESGFLDLLSTLPPGKSIMADRGFKIKDLLASSGTLLNIPPFKGPKSLAAADVLKTEKKLFHCHKLDLQTRCGQFAVF